MKKDIFTVPKCVQEKNAKMNQKRKIPLRISTIIEFIFIILALSINPIKKPTQDELIDVQGIPMFIFSLGLCAIFFIMRKHCKQSCPMINVICMLFSIFTILGQIYMKIGNWNAVFSDIVQLIKILICVVGYSLLYKNSILLSRWLLKQIPKIYWKKEACGKIMNWLFDKHPFLGAFLTIWVLEIPWLVCFFPGTLEPDARYQLYMAFGIVGMTEHHPVLVTKLMGKCIHICRFLFGADSLGIFAYTLLQFGLQSLVFAYTLYVLSRIKIPFIVRCGTLIYYSIYPLFPIWGYTMVKDSGYYILILLFVVTLVQLLYEQNETLKWWQIFLLLISVIGVSCFRKDGCFIIIITLVYGLVVYKKYRNIFLFGIITCLSCIFLISGIYVKLENIPKGSIKETLSIPLQQTARYVREHYEEMTPKEINGLQTVFTVDIEQLAELYNPEFADPIKYVFITTPCTNDLKSYFSIWWQQLLKHPDTYIQAFLNHTYGYFYPNKETSPIGEDIGVFQIAESPYFDLKFGIKNDSGRSFLENFSRMVKRTPVLGMLYNTGLHTWILLGCIFYLLAKKKWKELIIYIPGVCVVTLCILSPVNACVRYMLPVMALLPIHLSWNIETNSTK